MTKSQSALALCYFLLQSSIAFAQKDFDFGDVSLAELKMQKYERDTTAGAVILCDIGKLDGVNFTFTRHIRIKILSKAGLNNGNRTFNTPSKGDFKVLVFNLTGTQIIKEKATSSSIFKEEIVEGFNVYKVFAPGVRVGSVIDIQYSFVGIPFEWRFQETIPVAYSFLKLEPSQYISYSKSSQGFEPIETISEHEWSATNMPAFKIEPFLNDYSNYITKFNIQVTLFSVPGRFYFEYSTSWRNIVNNLLLHPRFGQIKSNSGFLNDFARELKEKKISTAEKVAEAYNYVQKNIKWSGVKSIYLSNEFRKNFLVDHVGNSADINLLLYALLEKAGLPAHPVVLSTRENGMILQFSPSSNKLNYVVVMVEDGNSEIMLDATSEDLIPGILPPYCLNGYGLMVKKDNEQWFNLNKKNIFSKKQFFTFTIDADNYSKVKLTQDYIGYAFVDWIQAFRANNSDLEITKNLIQKKFPETKILSYEILQNDKTTSKSKESLEFDLSEHVINTGDELILTPLMFLDYTKNPFKSEDRKYPVDLIYSKEYSSTIVVNFPAGYSISKIPESVKLTSPDGSVNFMFFASSAGTALQFRAILKFTKHNFDEKEYADIRRLYGEISRIITSPIELTKNSNK